MIHFIWMFWICISTGEPWTIIYFLILQRVPCFYEGENFTFGTKKLYILVRISQTGQDAGVF